MQKFEQGPYLTTLDLLAAIEAEPAKFEELTDKKFVEIAEFICAR